MRININQLRKIIKEEVSRARRRRRVFESMGDGHGGQDAEEALVFAAKDLGNAFTSGDVSSAVMGPIDNAFEAAVRQYATEFGATSEEVMTAILPMLQDMFDDDVIMDVEDAVMTAMREY